MPAELQQEALRHVDYLLARQAEQREGRDWGRFSAEQLVERYSDADTIYDKD